MPRSARRSVLWLSLLSALALPSESIPAFAPPPLRSAYYGPIHFSSLADVSMRLILPAAPAHDCAGENLHRLLAKWQRLLALEEWQFTIYCGLPEGSTIDQMGLTHSFPARRLAYVYIHPDARSIEETVVHELLHVALIDADDGGGRNLLDPEEHLVSLLTHRIYRSIEQ